MLGESTRKTADFLAGETGQVQLDIELGSRVIVGRLPTHQIKISKLVMVKQSVLFIPCPFIAGWRNLCDYRDSFIPFVQTIKWA